MTFDELLARVTELLQRQGRVSYRALKRRFSLDDDYLEDLKDELIKAKRLARDEEGAVLVWTGNTTVANSRVSVASSSQPLAPQTPNSELRTQDPHPQQRLRFFEINSVKPFGEPIINSCRPLFTHQLPRPLNQAS